LEISFLSFFVLSLSSPSLPLLFFWPSILKTRSPQSRPFKKSSPVFRAPRFRRIAPTGIKRPLTWSRCLLRRLLDLLSSASVSSPGFCVLFSSLQVGYRFRSLSHLSPRRTRLAFCSHPPSLCPAPPPFFIPLLLFEPWRGAISLTFFDQRLTLTPCKISRSVKWRGLSNVGLVPFSSRSWFIFSPPCLVA